MTTDIEKESEASLLKAAEAARKALKEYTGGWEQTWDTAFIAGHAHAQRWISVKERMPETEGRYLVFPIGKYYGEVVNFTLWPYDEIPSRNFFYDNDGMLHVVTPTHWMPLPPAPKGEE